MSISRIHCIFTRHKSIRPYSVEVVKAKDTLKAFRRLVRLTEPVPLVEPHIVDETPSPVEEVKPTPARRNKKTSVTKAASSSSALDLLASTMPKADQQPKIVRQYRELEAQYPGFMILLQVGEFYEILGDAAQKASNILDISICKPARYVTGDHVEMTGFPIRNMDGYIERLLKAGVSVAICDQVQDGLAIVRKCTRIITPGTVTEENLLAGGSSNFLLSIIEEDDRIGLAWIDISTGHFRVREAPKSAILDELSLISPVEIIAEEPLKCSDDLRRYIKVSQASFAADLSAQPEDIIDKIFGSDLNQKEYSPAELKAMTKLLNYVYVTQLDKQPFIEYPSRDSKSSSLHLDAFALRALEIVENNNTRSRENSLLDVLDITCTAAGSRLLTERLKNPLVDIIKINTRLDIVTCFYQRKHLTEHIRDFLKDCKDIERCFQRLKLNRSTGGPRDMQVIQQTLKRADELRMILIKENLAELERFLSEFPQVNDLVSELERALVEKLPARLSDGGVIREGYSPALDAIRKATSNMDNAKHGVIEKYKARTGLSTIRFSDRKTLGWLLEVPEKDAAKITKDPIFVLDSQVDGKCRFRTEELEAMNRQFSRSGDEILEMESSIYESLRSQIVFAGDEIMTIAKRIAEVDVYTAAATIALTNAYTRPQITDDLILLIEAGRHPVVESKHLDAGRTFVHNSIDLGPDKRFALLTGPNMGGKSTFLRQTALVVLMAQCGMYVPAAFAMIGIADAIFTRIGASDDLSRDRSTFMVEMSETANILKKATSRSLVIMDEIGRGTSSEEGFALAKGICAYLNDLECRSLFATHYSKLGPMVQDFKSSQCLMTIAAQDGEDLIFLHNVVEGVASQSHAIEIAKIAGIPTKVLEIARNQLVNPENK